MCSNLHTRTHSILHVISLPPSSLSIHLHIPVTSVMSNKTHTVKRPQTHTYTLTKEQHGHFVHAPHHQALPPRGVMKPTRLGEAPVHPWAITTPSSHYNLNLSLTEYSRIYEKGEGGKVGGSEMQSQQAGRWFSWQRVWLGYWGPWARFPLCGPGSD